MSELYLWSLWRDRSLMRPVAVYYITWYILKYCFSTFKLNFLLIEKNCLAIIIPLQIPSRFVSRYSGSKMIHWEFLYILKFWPLVNTDSASHRFLFWLSVCWVSFESYSKFLNPQESKLLHTKIQHTTESSKFQCCLLRTHGSRIWIEIILSQCENKTNLHSHCYLHQS